jgi:hypothetical protein
MLLMSRIICGTHSGSVDSEFVKFVLPFVGELPDTTF